MRTLILCVFALAACSPERIAPPQVPAPIEIAERPRPAPPPPSYQGVVTSRSSQMVTAPGENVIKELRVAPGDVVEAGHVIAILDDPALRASAQKLPKRSKARLQIEQRLAAMKLLAPVGGVVSSIQITKGATTKKGMSLLRISSTKRLQLRFALPQDATIAKGTKVKAIVPGRAKPLEAIVRSIGPATEAPLRISIVDADLSGANARDLAGLHGALADVTLAN